MSEEDKAVVIDATDAVLGRMATNVACKLLAGKRVRVVNAEKAVVTGNKEMIFKKYTQRVNRSSKVNPRTRGPFYPRRPDALVRRTVRSMLPFKKARGRNAYKLLKVYIGVPEDFEGSELESIYEASIRRYRGEKYVTVGQISKFLGSSF